MTAPAARLVVGSAAFDRFVSLLEQLVDALPSVEFRSLYHVLPLATQLAGLENPLFGSGRSPYSIISLLPRLTPAALSGWRLDLPLEERRALLDAVYDLTSAVLLDEAAEFADLRVDIEGLTGVAAVTRREDLFVQMDRLRPLANRLSRQRPGQFAHIAHFDTIEDLRREHAWLSGVPTDVMERWAARSFPTVVEVTFRGWREGLPEVTGWVLLIGNTTDQLMRDSRLRKAKIMQAARLAQRLGAGIVGMAGLIAFFGNGGHVLSETFPSLGFTTGHAYTIGNILEIATAASARVGLPLPHATVAVVGAAGSIGSGSARLLAAAGVRRLLLIDIWAEPLEAVATAIRAAHPGIAVETFVDMAAMRRADLTVVATNSTRRIVDSEHVRPGAVVIDDSFPKNVAESLARERTDVVLLEGGAVRLPRTLEIDRARNLPNISDVPFTRMVSCQEIYGCFAETLTLAVSDHRGNYGLGQADPVLAMDIIDKARRLEIGMAPLQFYGESLSDARAARAAAARKALQPATS
ncbi:MAG: hypothetical protein ACR2IT_10035 [Pirellulales bacterium]